MHQTWQYKDHEFTAPVPANIQPFVRILGVDDTIELLLKLGGSDIYFPQSRTHVDALLANIIGQERACLLGKALNQNIVRVPVASTFICRHLKGAGRSVQEISRAVRLSNVAVRGHLSGMPRAHAPTPDKVPLKSTLVSQEAEPS